MTDNFKRFRNKAISEALTTAQSDITDLESLTSANEGFTSDSTITLSTGGSATQTATIQLKDSTGTNIAAVHKLRVYMCTDSAGATPSSSGAATSATVTTGTLLKAVTTKLDFEFLTNSSGVGVITFDNTGGGGAYTNRVVLVLPNGKLVVSSALNVATS